MIFLTTGTQLPFDRLVRAVDEWASTHPEIAVFGQIGASDFRPSNFEWERSISPTQFESRIAACETVVAHAGMGTIISGIEWGKRVLVMPRLAAFGEHRNDHQIATADRLQHLKGLEVVHTPQALKHCLGDSPAMTECDALEIDVRLIETIRQFSGLRAA
jgi:UDP-N-acetylglucosamine transferase subunit ALG13